MDVQKYIQHSGSHKCFVLGWKHCSLTDSQHLYGLVGKEKKKAKKKGCGNNNFCHNTVSSGYLLNIETSTKISTFYTVYDTIWLSWIQIEAKG